MAGLERLKRRPEFLRVAATKRKWVSPGLILQARRRDPAAVTPTATGPDRNAPGHDAPRGAPARVGPARVGFTVSRKVGNAVARNRARRRLRAAADAVMPRHAAGGEDYVLIGRAGTLTRPFAALLADLEAGLKRLGAWRPGAPDGPGSSRTGPNRTEETKQP